MYLERVKGSQNSEGGYGRDAGNVRLKGTNVTFGALPLTTVAMER
jgi:hypothetical protein